LIVGALCLALIPGASARAQVPLPDLQVAVVDTVATPTGNTVQLKDWQVGYFRRPGGALVVTAFDIARDSVWWQFLSGWGMKQSSPAVALGWSGEISVVSRPSVEDELIRGGSATFDGQPRAKWSASVEAPWDTVMVRMGLSAPPDPMAMNRLVQAGVVGRAQVVVGPPRQPDQELQVSDILLYEPDERQPPVALTGKNGALARALGSTALMGRRKMGMFWEVYGLPQDEPAEATLTVIRVMSHGDVQTVLVSDTPTILDAKTVARLQWPLRLQGSSAVGVSPFAVVLDVGSLGVGRHAAVLTVTVPGQEPVTVVREFRVEVPATR
jgi:hypothetical protein